MKRFFLTIFARWIFLLFYFAGLTFLIPAIITAKIPKTIFLLQGSPYLLLVLSFILIFIGVVGMYFLRGDMKYAMRSLGWATILPVIIAVLILIFGETVIINMADKFESIKPFVEYLLSGIPKTLYLIASYFIVAVGWFWFSRRMP